MKMATIYKRTVNVYNKLKFKLLKPIYFSVKSLLTYLSKPFKILIGRYKWSNKHLNLVENSGNYDWSKDLINPNDTDIYSNNVNYLKSNNYFVWLILKSILITTWWAILLSQEPIDYIAIAAIVTIITIEGIAFIIAEYIL